eukprot:6625819-Pyramimonas_sp.AAC.1
MRLGPTNRKPRLPSSLLTLFFLRGANWPLWAQRHDGLDNAIALARKSRVETVNAIVRLQRYKQNVAVLTAPIGAARGASTGSGPAADLRSDRRRKHACAKMAEAPRNGQVRVEGGGIEKSADPIRGFKARGPAPEQVVFYLYCKVMGPCPRYAYGSSWATSKKHCRHHPLEQTLEDHCDDLK